MIWKLREAIRVTQNNKATGLHDIPGEVLKPNCLSQLLEVCNKAYHSDIPEMWFKGAILPFPEKRDLRTMPTTEELPFGSGNKDSQ